jgi:hypothetical protein
MLVCPTRGFRISAQPNVDPWLFQCVKPRYAGLLNGCLYRCCKACFAKLRRRREHDDVAGQTNAWDACDRMAANSRGKLLFTLCFPAILFANRAAAYRQVLGRML